MKTRIIEVRQGVLKKNDVLARALRDRFARTRTYVLSLVSSPGAGKTALLEATLRLAQPRFRAGALVGDLATENDATRLARSGAPVRQIITGTVCHLDAEMVESALTAWNPGPLDLLCIENVGNLVCPAAYDLGEDMRVVLFSVTEGEDKPLKYPAIFNTADAVLITKIDLAEPAAFERDAAYGNLHRVRPGLPVLEVSARTGRGMAAWMVFLQDHISRKAAGDAAPDDGRGAGRDCGMTPSSPSPTGRGQREE